MTAAPGAVRPRVLIDCDPGHDDVLAIAVAAAHCDVVGITVVAGNSGLANTERNARMACDLFGLTSVPVHAGANRPLVAPPRDAADAHGKSGLDGPELFDPQTPLASHDAVGFLVEQIRAEEGLWLIPTGPLTNVALAFRVAPDLPGRLAGISFMGGSATHGNVTTTAEFNIWADPEAAAMVVEAGVPTRMLGLNLTHQVRAGQPSIDRLRAEGTRASVFAADMINFYRRIEARWRNIPLEQSMCVLHDPCAVLAVTHPELFTFERRRVDVELNGTHTRGMTVVDMRPWRGQDGAHVDVAMQVDGAAAVAMVEQAVRAAPASG